MSDNIPNVDGAQPPFHVEGFAAEKIFTTKYICNHPIIATEGEFDRSERKIFDRDLLRKRIFREVEACRCPDDRFDQVKFELFVTNKAAQLQTFALKLIQQKKFMHHLPDFCVCIAELYMRTKQYEDVVSYDEEQEEEEEDDYESSNEEEEDFEIKNDEKTPED